MQQYMNLSGNSGVLAYEIGDDFIRVQFKHGITYLYNYGSTGQQNVENMKTLAIRGSGLGGFISTNVGKAYAAKMR